MIYWSDNRNKDSIDLKDVVLAFEDGEGEHESYYGIRFTMRGSRKIDWEYDSKEMRDKEIAEIRDLKKPKQLAQKKPYNPNTSYGRKKLREQAQNTYDNLPPKQKKEWDSNKAIVIVLIVVVIFIIFLATGNSSGFLKWLSR